MCLKQGLQKEIKQVIYAKRRIFFETLGFFKIAEQKYGDSPQLLRFVYNLQLSYPIFSPHTAYLSPEQPN